MKGSRVLKSFNPATGECLWTGTHADEAVVQSAFQAASTALKSWASLPLKKRMHYVTRFQALVLKKRALLAELIASETGKPLWESFSEVDSVVAKISISIKAHTHRLKEEEKINLNGALGGVRYKPQGVVAILGPFNFPVHLSNGHLIPALLAGNTILYKPSEYCPKTAEFILSCFDECGLPKGVVNGLYGDKETALALLKLPIQAVFFTGSYATGLSIHKAFSHRPEVLLALEMGGNNPLVVTEVKNKKAALYATLLSCFITAGQRCSCARRLLLPDNAFGDDFLQQLLKASEALQIGPYTQTPEPFMGPVIHFHEAEKHLENQKKLIDLGAHPLKPMQLVHKNKPFLTPGLLTIPKHLSMPDEEIFAPLVQIYRFDSFEEALHLSNQTQYGLSAGLVSDKKTQFDAFCDIVQAGVIHWNRPTTGASSELPFGGLKHSGNHRASAYFAADYCANPIATLETKTLKVPDTLLPGVNL